MWQPYGSEKIMQNLHNNGKKVRQNTQIYMDMIDEYSESAEKIHNKITVLRDRINAKRTNRSGLFNTFEYSVQCDDLKHLNQYEEIYYDLICTINALQKKIGLLQ